MHLDQKILALQQAVEVSSLQTHDLIAKLGPLPKHYVKRPEDGEIEGTFPVCYEGKVTLSDKLLFLPFVCSVAIKLTTEYTN